MDPNFVKKIITIRGDAGKKWLEEIPQVIKKYESLWEISCFDPFVLSYNYVAPAKTKSGEDVVLKICLPPVAEAYYEIPALKFFNGNGAVKLLQEDREQNVLLLERAIPGKNLHATLQQETAIEIIVQATQQLHKPISKNLAYSFPTLLDWAKDFVVYRKKFSLSSGPIPQNLFEKAEEIFTTYPTDNREKVLLHGDLHAENILTSKRGYLAIDPKGIIGEREFDLGIFFRSPYQDFPADSNYAAIIARKISECAEKLHLDKKRILDWAFASAVNGLVWFLEDENRLRKEYLENAKILNSVDVS